MISAEVGTEIETAPFPPAGLGDKDLNADSTAIGGMSVKNLSTDPTFFCELADKKLSTDSASIEELQSCTVTSPRRSEGACSTVQVPTKKVKKSGHRISSCQFCVDFAYLPFCPRTGVPHRSSNLYYTTKRAMHADVYIKASVPQEKRQKTEKEKVGNVSKNATDQTEQSEASSAVKKTKTDSSVHKTTSHSTPGTQATSASRPLAAFGFTMKTKPVVAVPANLQNLLIHDFQDNDEMRRMSTIWYQLREQTDDADEPKPDMDSILLQMGAGEEVIPLTPSSSPAFTDCPLSEFISDIRVHTSPANDDSFDSELVFASWGGEGYEEVQARPAYYGTHNVYKELWGNLFSIESHSIIPQAPYLENDYENSAEEWQSEPSDAESCSSEGESDDDIDDANEFDDVVVPDEDESPQAEWQYPGVSSDDFQQIVQERESSRKRNMQRNLMRISRGEIMRAKVIEIAPADAVRGECVLLWDLSELTVPDIPAESHDPKPLQANELATDPMKSPKIEPVQSTKRVYNSVDAFFTQLLETEIIDRRKLDKMLFKKPASPKIQPVQLKPDDASETGDMVDRRPVLEGTERQTFIDFVLLHKNSGFNNQIMCHEFHKEYPTIGSSEALSRTLHKLMMRRDNEWRLKRRFNPQETKPAQSDASTINAQQPSVARDTHKTTETEVSISPSPTNAELESKHAQGATSAVEGSADYPHQAPSTSIATSSTEQSYVTAQETVSCDLDEKSMSKSTPKKSSEPQLAEKGEGTPVEMTAKEKRKSAQPTNPLTFYFARKEKPQENVETVNIISE